MDIKFIVSSNYQTNQTHDSFLAILLTPLYALCAALITKIIYLFYVKGFTKEIAFMLAGTLGLTFMVLDVIIYLFLPNKRDSAVIWPFSTIGFSFVSVILGVLFVCPSVSKKTYWRIYVRYSFSSWTLRITYCLLVSYMTLVFSIQNTEKTILHYVIFVAYSIAPFCLLALHLLCLQDGTNDDYLDYYRKLIPFMVGLFLYISTHFVRNFVARCIESFALLLISFCFWNMLVKLDTIQGDTRFSCQGSQLIWIIEL